VRTHVSLVTLGPKQATAFVLILTELLSNAIEHAFSEQEKGEIYIGVAQGCGEALLEIRDSGRGLPPGFDVERAESLGLRLISRLAERDLGGSVVAWNDGGACFRVAFPIQKSEEDK